MGEYKTEHSGNATLRYIPTKDIQRVLRSVKEPYIRARAAAEMFRINALYMIRVAGSGHPGSTFSALDILTWLWLYEMRKPNTKKGDTFFSSKGHDVPGLYALLIGLGHLPEKYIHTLRQYGGLPGHPDIATRYIATNTGSLGMGISKARGMATAGQLSRKRHNIYVLLGDGELQEGQIWESLQPTANRNMGEIIAIVDNNKFQSDRLVSDTSDLGNLIKKFRAFGWVVAKCNGHDFGSLERTLTRLKKHRHKPKLLIADTKKGKGVSFMEQPGHDGFYAFHSGSPSPELYAKASGELFARLEKILEKADVTFPRIVERPLAVVAAPLFSERLVSAHSAELLALARAHRRLVAMDGDLILDHGLIPFRQMFPERYIQCGIAEQDMVSFAGGLALRGVLPVVHSFECFLTTRANEHFYNNASEQTKIIYVGGLAGLLPGTPGHSHQSLRGISSLGSIPGLTLVQPSNEIETRMALRWAVKENKQSTYIRLVSIPCTCPFTLPKGYALREGRGVPVRTGTDIMIFAYGPVMLEQAMQAAAALEQNGISASVVNLPWLNKIDQAWLLKTVRDTKAVITIDDHYTTLGQGVQIAGALARGGYHGRIASFGVDEIPVCGSNTDVLKHHKLDHASLVRRILAFLE